MRKSQSILTDAIAHKMDFSSYLFFFLQFLAQAIAIQ